MNNVLSKYIPLFLVVCSFVFVQGCFDNTTNTSENGDAPAVEEQTPVVEEQAPAAEEQAPAEVQVPAVEEQTLAKDLQTNQYSESNHSSQQVDPNFFYFLIALIIIVCVFLGFLYLKESHNKKYL